ncbi:MAG: pyrroline-5-carboxylate reductase [Balneolaceae bacterium]
MKKTIAIIGAGNIGTAIAGGLIQTGTVSPEQIILTRRRTEHLQPWKAKGCRVTDSNTNALQKSDIIILAVEPSQTDGVLNELHPYFNSRKHTVVSVISGVSIQRIKKLAGRSVPVVRAMPNTAISIGESMTCLCADESDRAALDEATTIFGAVGRTIVIMEEQMTAATALCACGIAFFLRSIRAASQGGTEIGFHAHEALEMAAQTAKGAASLLAGRQHHPEFEIDRVTTPRGCTISGLNEMEHGGFSSAMIKGILVSATKADDLYNRQNGDEE